MKAIEQRMDISGETQVSLTDPDARAMATTSRRPRVVGYNVQSAVETKHHLIVAHEVTNLGYDRDALAMMAHAGRQEMSSDDIEAIADKGYYKGEEIVACEERVSRSPCPSRTPRTPQPMAASIVPTSPTSPMRMLMSARPESD